MPNHGLLIIIIKPRCTECTRNLQHTNARSLIIYKPAKNNILSYKNLPDAQRGGGASSDRNLWVDKDKRKTHFFFRLQAVQKRFREVHRVQGALDIQPGSWMQNIENVFNILVHASTVKIYRFIRLPRQGFGKISQT